MRAGPGFGRMTRPELQRQGSIEETSGRSGALQFAPEKLKGPLDALRGERRQPPKVGAPKAQSATATWGCATISFCDAEGELVGAIRMSRAPKHKKASLKKQLTAEVTATLKKRSELRLIKLADAVVDNWKIPDR